MKIFIDYYAVLGVEPALPAERIRKVYYVHAERLHDKGEFADAMRGITEAWGVVRDPARRAAFDKERRLRLKLCKFCNGGGLRAAGMRGELKRCGNCNGTGTPK